VERRLAAIFALDVVGYSRLIGADEAGTLTMLRTLRKDLVEPALKRHRGRVVKLMGDGLLAEFVSVVDAVSAAVEIQEAMPERSAHLPEDRRVAVRIGVNIGDVVVEDGDLFGDGVNIAARLQEVADPNGVAISEGVHRELRGKLDLPFVDAGEKNLKNIAEPLRTWLWSPTNMPIDVPPPDAPLALPDMPSIAVLPFDNMSGDPEQEYFADGIVEEIITALSRFNWLLVMARNSSFVYKGRSVDVRQIGKELDARYVLEGSVRRAGDRVRITGKLIEAATGAHIWADRFDGDMTDLFELQDDITASVVGAIEPSIRKAEIERARRKRPDSLAAYDLYLRALTPLNEFRADANGEALELLQRAIEIDPGYAPALAYAAWCYEQRLLHDWPTKQESDAETATELARAALAIKSDDAAAISMAAFVLTIVGHDYDGGRRAAERAIDLNPNSASVCWKVGWVIMFAGDPEAALPVFERSLRLSPLDPQANFLLNGMAMCHLVLGSPEEAFECASKAEALSPDIDVTYYIIIPACGYLEREQEAKRAIKKLLTLAPGLTISNFGARMPFRNAEHLDILLEGFRKGGLPE